MGSVKFSIRGYEVPSEPSEPSGTPGCFWRKLVLLLMVQGGYLPTRVAAVNFVGEYPWQVCEYGGEWLFLDCQWRTSMVSQTLNSVPLRLLIVQLTTLLGHTAHTSALEPIQVVTMPGVVDTLKTVINKMRYGSDFKLVNLLKAEYVNLTNEDPKRSIGKRESRWIFNLVLYNSLSRVKSTNNNQLSYNWWSFGIVDDSHQYRSKSNIGWQTANKSENWIQTSSHCYARIPFTDWLVLPDDVPYFRFVSQSTGLYCDWKGLSGGTVLRYKEFNARRPHGT